MIFILLLETANSGLAQGKQVLHDRLQSIVSHLKSTGELPGSKRLELVIGLPLRNQAALDELLRQIYDPASTNYHRYLTPKQFAEKFGPTEQDYQKLVSFARANGLTVTGTDSERTLLNVSGTVTDIQRLFHVTLRTYKHPAENRTFYAPDAEPSIDFDLPILHVTGLDDFVVPRPASLKKNLLRNKSANAPPASGSGPSGLYMGNDFRAAYVPGATLTGAGQTVGLLELDGYYTNDIASYESQAGLPNVPLLNVPIDGGVSSPGDGDVEVALDIEMAISMSPGLFKIIVYEAPNDSLSVLDILHNMATNDLANQISSSWLVGNDANFDVQYLQFAAQGQSYFQASGDDGAFYPGIGQSMDDTNITLVGGTTLSTSGPGGSWSSETVWNWYITDPPNTNASGGGISANFSIPSWQSGINMTTNQGSTTMRNVPDVALTADEIYVKADNGSGYSVGGTSAAAPLWAAYSALVNQQAISAGRHTVGFVNPAVYAIGKSTNFTADFHDIVTGNNTNAGSPNNYFAVSGYDLCTGWGTPTGTNLINDLAGLPDALTIAPATNFFSSGAAGGPFNGTQVFSLVNSGASSLNWILSNSAPWLNVSPASGTLSGGGQTTVTASLNSAANILTPGTYVATLSFTNQNDGGAQFRQLILQVSDSLAITPANGFTSSRFAGGSFNVTSQNFTLNNGGVASLNWQIGNTSSWLNASPTSGTLAGGTQTNVIVSLNSTASNLVSGTYASTIFFTNQTSGGVQSRQFTLLIGLPENGGFETGDFTGWTLNGDGYNANYVDGSGKFIAPHSGMYCALLGEPGFLAYLSQNLPTFAGQSYLLSLWLNNPLKGSSSNPNEFSVSWNGSLLYDKVNVGKIGWTNMLFIVTATNNSTVLQIGGRDDNYYLGLDDVSLTPIPTVSLQTSPLSTNNNFQFSWNALTGLVYQVQFKTNLLQTNWLTLKTIAATNTPVTFMDTNSTASPSQKFYRLLLLP